MIGPGEILFRNAQGEVPKGTSLPCDRHSSLFKAVPVMEEKKKNSCQKNVWSHMLGFSLPLPFWIRVSLSFK